MDKLRLKEWFPDGGEEHDYLLETAFRLERLIDGRVMSLDDWVALLRLLVESSIVFNDGFVLNDMSRSETVIGNREAALLVAVLEGARERDADWWHRNYLWEAVDAGLENRLRTLRQWILQSPDVLRIE